MSHCITESADGVWAPGAVLQELAPRPRLETGDPGQGNTGNEEWWQEGRLQGVFSNTDSFYFLPHTQNKNRERYASALSKYCFFITVGLVTGLQRRGLQWLHHDAGTQHCSTAVCSCMQRPERGHAAPQLAPTSVMPG